MEVINQQQLFLLMDSNMILCYRMRNDKSRLKRIDGWTSETGNGVSHTDNWVSGFHCSLHVRT